MHYKIGFFPNDTLIFTNIQRNNGYESQRSVYFHSMVIILLAHDLKQFTRILVDNIVFL